MKCATHPEVDATGFCRNCGRALCPQCTRDVRGVLYCETCLADLLSRPAPATTPAAASPGLAAFLGFIPGLGAVYNGEYMKALVHVAVFAGFVYYLSGEHSDPAQATAGILLAAFIVYMSIDAYRSAKARVQGQVLASPLQGVAQGKLVGPAILIALGLLFLLNNMGVLNLDRVFDLGWPGLLILIGVVLLWRRLGPTS